MSNTQSDNADRPAFERLRVGRLAVRFCVACTRLADALPKGRAVLGSQLRRSATATMQGVAEGAGRFKAGEKAYRYMTAKAECEESLAHLAALEALGSVGEDASEEARSMGIQITRMLTALIKRWDPSAVRQGEGRRGEGGTDQGQGAEKGAGNEKD